ncbi:serine hydrolase domain-containing protein [Nocardioides kongjuensis]|uniref:CubicO group peptidase (Beta-lactamase class C family) n=1 Tax=Nocardioides kongjuensis TaxID=349522 RepID=A0A852RHH4_9ACTN|nr:serine hydrolase domain-containing protein [Nocardioides kongjuensis]NYD30595.1 CubicO group peptidase (beta-lactamase class C family) [Nocardioides kongjuensis]
MRGIDDWLERRLPELLEGTGVPAAAVAVAHGDEVVDAAAGTLSAATGVTATTDAIFQVGSITKVLTATLVQQLVDEGLVDLDRPVRTWLPGLRLGDESAAATLTVRQLLTHTAGFEGDVFTDTGKGDDCVEKYVDLLSEVPQLFPPGEMWSYNNAGFCVLGRLVEVVRAAPYDTCLRAHLLDPLGMTSAATDPYEAVLHRTAVGHVDGRPTDVWALARSNAPAGSMLAMRARDLVAFARHHLENPALAGMRTPQVALPDLGQGEAWGLGWELFRLAPTPIVGHDGNTIGQSAFLRLLPEHDLAVAVLTNGGPAKLLHRAVTGHVLRELAGVDLPPAPEPPATISTPDPTRYAGTYASEVGQTVVSQDGQGRLWLDRTPLGVLAEIDEPPYRTELVAWRGETLWPLEPEGGVHQPVAFLGDDGTGRAAYLHTGRADRRTR